MRFSTLVAVPLVAALVAAPVRAPAQVSATIHLGPAITVGDYSASTYGDWHTHYRRWTPVTLYSYNGHYYSRNVRGSRAVMVYRSGKHYFLPPQDQAWNNADKRYNYARRPTDDDYHHTAPPPRPHGP